MKQIFSVFLLFISVLAQGQTTYWTLPAEMRGNSEFTGNITVPATGLLFKTNGTLIKSGTGALTVTSGANNYTLTVPATGTVALLGTANNFSAAQTFSGGFAAQTISGAVTWSGAQTFGADATIATNVGAKLTIKGIADTVASGDILGQIDFVSSDLSTGGTGSVARISATALNDFGSNSRRGRINFYAWDALNGEQTLATFDKNAITLSQPVTATAATRHSIQNSEGAAVRTLNIDNTNASATASYLAFRTGSSPTDRGFIGFNSSGDWVRLNAAGSASPLFSQTDTGAVTLGPASGLTDPHIFRAGGSSSTGGDDPEAGTALFTTYTSGGSGMFNVASFHLDRNTVGEGAGITFALDDAGGSRRNYGLIGYTIADNTDASLDGTLKIQQVIANTMTDVITATAGAVTLGPDAGFSSALYHTVNGPTATTTSAIVLVKKTGSDSSSNYYLTALAGAAGTTEQGGLWNNASGNFEVFTSSDARIKEDIRDADYGLQEIVKLRPRTFTKNGIPNVKGFVAQEVEEILPEAVGQIKSNGLDDFRILSTATIIPVMVRAIQEQQAMISSLRSENRCLANADTKEQRLACF